jgi:hypothetical protein
MKLVNPATHRSAFVVRTRLKREGKALRDAVAITAEFKAMGYGDVFLLGLRFHER